LHHLRLDLARIVRGEERAEDGGCLPPSAMLDIDFHRKSSATPRGCTFGPPLGLGSVEEMLAFHGTGANHETVRQRARRLGQSLANEACRRLQQACDKWHLDKVCLHISARRSQRLWTWLEG
jgi:hypothetical protein